MAFPKISSGKTLREEEVEDEGSAAELYDRQKENRKGELIPIDLLYITTKHFHKSSMCV